MPVVFVVAGVLEWDYSSATVEFYGVLLVSRDSLIICVIHVRGSSSKLVMM